MDALASYANSSDEDNGDKKVTAGTGAPNKDMGDTNYDEVKMEMSEESSTSPESALPSSATSDSTSSPTLANHHRPGIDPPVKCKSKSPPPKRPREEIRSRHRRHGKHEKEKSKKHYDSEKSRKRPSSRDRSSRRRRSRSHTPPRRRRHSPSSRSKHERSRSRESREGDRRRQRRRTRSPERGSGDYKKSFVPASNSSNAVPLAPRPSVQLTTAKAGDATHPLSGPVPLQSNATAAHLQRLKEVAGVPIPGYYHPTSMNLSKLSAQTQKKKLLWGAKEKESGSSNHWESTTFAEDQDGKMSAKFRRLMGIKGDGAEGEPAPKSTSLLKKQEEMFNSMEKQYEVARLATHTQRGVGLGFGSMSAPFPPKP